MFRVVDSSLDRKHNFERNAGYRTSPHKNSKFQQEDEGIDGALLELVNLTATRHFAYVIPC